MPLSCFHKIAGQKFEEITLQDIATAQKVHLNLPCIWPSARRKLGPRNLPKEQENWNEKREFVASAVNVLNVD